MKLNNTPQSLHPARDSKFYKAFTVRFYPHTLALTYFVRTSPISIARKKFQTRHHEVLLEKILDELKEPTL